MPGYAAESNVSIIVSASQYLVEAQFAFALDKMRCVVQHMNTICQRICAMQILTVQCFTSWQIAEVSAAGTTPLQSSLTVQPIRLSNVVYTRCWYSSTVREHSVNRDHRGFSAFLLLSLAAQPL